MSSTRTPSKSSVAITSNIANALYVTTRGSIAFALGVCTAALARRRAAGLGLRAYAGRRRIRRGTPRTPPPPPETLTVTNNRTGDVVRVRRLRADDYERGFYDVLAQLTVVGEDNTRDKFLQRFDAVSSGDGGGGPEYVYVVTTTSSGGGGGGIATDEHGHASAGGEERIVASGTLVLERKFTRSCGLCGHIEDVVVDSRERGKDLGRALIEALTMAAKASGCYKVILDCNEANAGFYERCGYVRKEIQMAKYFV